jgi:hypothetical protein
LGGLDQWKRNFPIRRFAAKFKAGGFPVNIIAYPFPGDDLILDQKYLIKHPLTPNKPELRLVVAHNCRA